MTKPNLTQQEVLRVQKNAAKAPAFLAFTTRPLLPSSGGVQEQEARAQRSSTAARLRMSQQLPRCATNQFGQRHFSSVLPRCSERVGKRLEIVRSFKSAVDPPQHDNWHPHQIVLYRYLPHCYLPYHILDLLYSEFVFVRTLVETLLLLNIR